MTSSPITKIANNTGQATSSLPLIWLEQTPVNQATTDFSEAWEQLGGEYWLPEEAHSFARIGPALQSFIRQHPERDLLLIGRHCLTSALTLQQFLAATAAQEGLQAYTVLSNAQACLNPFHNLKSIRVMDAESNCVSDAGGAAELVSALGTGDLFPVDQWPQHFLFLPVAAIGELAHASVTAESALARLQDAGGSLLLCDSLFVPDSKNELLSFSTLENHESELAPPWSELNSRLAGWLSTDARLPENFARNLAAAADRLLTLHITHSWGGGVARWVSSFIDADEPGLHLQLRSEGAQSGHGAGQKVSLYAGNELKAPLASWWLKPVIRSSVEQHPHYPEILQQICRRYAVGRVFVSSLVGHSLQALNTGLPTLQVLHDYYPLWPLLSLNPEPFLAEDHQQALPLALQQHALLPDFGQRDAAGWLKLATQWRETLQSRQVQLAAPSHSVVSLLRQLDEQWNELDIEVIPHGLTAFADTADVLPKDRPDGRLRLVIPGRMQAGKGQALLLEALPELTRLAQVYLVGTGKEGEAFFGHPGVNVILHYEREELPGILREIGPHLAALLSVVPETFSYTLSEMKQLGIPVLATRMGSLAERISDGKDGWLINPLASDLVAKLEQIATHREVIAIIRQELANQPDYSTRQMVERYQQQCPLAPARNQPAVHEKAALPELQQGAADYHATGLQQQNHRLEILATELQKEVEKRTDWARKREAALQEEQRNRDRWVSLLQGEIESLQELVKGEQRRYAAFEEESRARIEQILQSSSWRITRPLRVSRRLLANLSRARAWNPSRWPLLLSQIVRTVSTSGWSGALVRAQVSPQDISEPAYAATIASEAIGDLHPPLNLPQHEQPYVSIVIPVYNKWEYTAACLRSLAETENLASFEVILVDDHSSDSTAERASGVIGLQYLRNEENLGFVGSCNRGLQAARGDFTVLLNNDTQVLDGWLDALLDTFDRFPDTGLAGAQLLYPNGSLQEAGGIIFRDGSGWNYGRGDKAEKPEYQYVREVDYCSGACIMLRTELFLQLDGFDARYAPAYYEDTDLAFRVREAGFKVRYQPAARIIHHEGISSGTDLNSGVKRYQQINREKFLQRWQSELAQYPKHIDHPEDRRSIRAARDHRLRGRVLIIDAYTPEPDQDSGSLRMCYLFDCFRELGYGVSFFADNRGFAGHYSEAIQASGVEVLYNPWIASLQDFFRERGPEFDFVLVSRHYVACNYIALVRKYCPQAKFIFDTVDLHYLREERLAELEDSLPLRRAAAQTKRSELAVIQQSDATLVVSPVEQEVLRQAAKESRVEVLSNIHRVEGCQKPFAQRKDLFFVGGYQHPPNIDAAQWFVNSIWPLVRQQLPDVNFHLLGSKAPEQIRQLQGDGVVFHGFVADLNPWIDGCRLAVAPLRYGAGVKGKVNISMSRGQPVVATPAAVEGLQAVAGEEILVADNAEDFAAAVVRLYQDQALWERLSAGGLHNVEQYFSLDTARRNLADLLKSLA